MHAFHGFASGLDPVFDALHQVFLLIDCSGRVICPFQHDFWHGMVWKGGASLAHTLGGVSKKRTQIYMKIIRHKCAVSKQIIDTSVPFLSNQGRKTAILSTVVICQTIE